MLIVVQIFCLLLPSELRSRPPTAAERKALPPPQGERDYRHSLTPSCRGMLPLIARSIGVCNLHPRGASVLFRVDSLSAVARPGDHVAVLGPSAPVWHHGILADSAHVIDLYGASKATAVVSRRSIADFLQGVTAAAVVHYPDDDDGFRLLTLRLAEAYSTSKLNRKGQYDALRRNCESFATWCRSTQWTSHQSEVMQDCARARSMGLLVTLLHMLSAVSFCA